MKLLSCLLLLISIKATIAQPVLEPAERARQEEAIAKAADMWRQRFQQIDRGSESSEVIEQLAEVAKAMRHFQDSKAKLNVQPVQIFLRKCKPSWFRSRATQSTTVRKWKMV